MKTNTHSKEKLIEMLLFLRDKEAKKPLNEMDTETISACTELLLDLQNKDVTLSTEEIEERVKRIPFFEKDKPQVEETKRKLSAKRILLVAAVVAVLFTIVTLSTIGSEWNMFDPLIDKYGSVAEAPEGVVFFENGTSYWVGGPAKTYESFDEWAQNENTDLLLPKKFPDSFTFNGIMVSTENKNEHIVFSFRDGSTSYVVHRNTPISQGVLDNATPITIGNTLVYFEDLHEVNHYQVHFSYEGDSYYIGHSNKGELLEIIEELKPYL